MKLLNPTPLGRILDILIWLCVISAMVSLIVFSSKLLFLILILSSCVLFVLDVVYFVRNADFNDWD